MLLIYLITVRAYTLLIYIISPFNSKAAKWINGRENIFSKIKEELNSNDKHAWFHFASLGEFEQGRPVLEKYKSQNPDMKILMTFFSPSGYEIRKDYPLADHVFYLPADTRSNASRFVSLVNPEIVFFTKYEYWYFYFDELKKRNIPLYVISGIFRKDQLFFKWYGGFYRSILKKVNHFFLQDESSAALLNSINISNHTVSGDTRLDRVLENAKNSKENKTVELFKGEHKLLIAGSTWPADEKIITTYINSHPGIFKYIIAPHEISESNVKAIEKSVSLKCITYSEALNKDSSKYDVLIIDNIGILMSLYRYAYIAYIGGGFGRGIHNTQEALAFGLPVVFGPEYSKFKEAVDLVKNKSAFVIHDKNEFSAIVKKLEHDKTFYKKVAASNAEYVERNAGASDKIVQLIKRE